MKFILSLLLSSITAIVLAQAQQEKRFDFIDRCLNESGLTNETLRDPSPEMERNMTCFISCMGQTSGVLDKDGNPNIEKAKEVIAKQFKEEEKQKEAAQVFEECAQEVKQMDSDDVCLKGFTLFQCIAPPEDDDDDSDGQEEQPSK